MPPRDAPLSPSAMTCCRSLMNSSMTPRCCGSGRSLPSWTQLVRVHALFPLCACVCVRVCARVCVCSSHKCAVLTRCVFVVMDFENMMGFWLKASPKLREEHETYKKLLETLTEELVKLSTSFAGHSGWKTYSDRRPKYPGTKRTSDGQRRAKTALEQLSSSDESEDERPETMAEKEARQKRRHEGGGDAEFLGVLQSIGFDEHEEVDDATARLVNEHVQEFVRERLNPTSKIRDALQWWAGKEATWPMVAAVARHSLCVPAAAACSERGFSATGHIVRARRSRLSDDKITELSHLCNNLDE